MKPAPVSSGPFEIVRQSAKGGEVDRYLSALLAPPDVRGDLIVLAALKGEVWRIGREVRDVHLAEIKLQWWRDAVLASGETASGHPIADAFAELIKRRAVPPAMIEDWFEAYAHTFYAAGPQSVADFIVLQERLEGVPFAIAALLCGAPPGAALQQQTAMAGVAYGCARQGLELPYQLAHERMPFPREWEKLSAAQPQGNLSPAVSQLIGLGRAKLAEVKTGWAGFSRATRTALLPVALAEPYFRVLEKPGHKASRDIGDVVPLTRVAKLLSAQIRGRL